MLRVIVAMILLAGSDAGSKYTGPKCLGPFCIDHNVSASRLFKRLGPPPRKAFFFQPYCYRSKNGGTSLYMNTFHDRPDIAADVSLADFPSCMHTLSRITQDNLHAWKTREGIGLGSLEKDVLKAYGKASSEDKVDKNNTNQLKALIYGYELGDIIPPIGDKILSYNGEISTDLRAAGFCIKHGRVSCVWVSYNE